MKASKAERIPEHMAPQRGDIRLFKNPVLERLSKISPVTVLAVYLPIIIFFIWKSFAIDIPAGTFFVLFLCGLAFWTLFEYFFHRYVFHFTPKGEFQKRISFLFHGVHHQYPNDKKRLVLSSICNFELHDLPPFEGIGLLGSRGRCSGIGFPSPNTA